MSEKDQLMDEIVNQYLSLKTRRQKQQFVQSLPENIKIPKFLDKLSALSSKVEFLRLLNKTDSLYNKWGKIFNKEKLNISKKLISSKGSYQRINTLLNQLREKGESLLIKEALNFAENKKQKYAYFFNSIQQAEHIVELLKENEYNNEVLKKYLTQNFNSIKENKIVLENLKDLFKNDRSLKTLQKDFSDFIVNNIDSDKPVAQVISEAEKKILSGDISDVYNELEKTEKIISSNINRLLIDIFNSIQVMSAKKDFVDYIKNFESENISQIDINSLENRSNEYRNIELPNKWEEMKYKIQYTSKISHYKAWYEGLQHGRYKMVVTNVKEFVVKELIKKILQKLALNYKNLNIPYSTFISMLDSKKLDRNDLKVEFKKIEQLPKIDSIKSNELFIQFESYMIYYFYLNYDLHIEKEIVNKILKELENKISVKDKYQFLIEEKENIINSIKNDELRNDIETIFEKFIHLYNILNEKIQEKEKFEIPKEKAKAKEKEKKKEKQVSIKDTMGFLDNAYKEVKKTKNVDSLLKNIDNLSDDEVVDIISTMKLDPRLEYHFSDVEENMYDRGWGRVIGAITYKTKKIEKEFGMQASEQYLEDIANKIAAKTGEDAFIVKKIRNMRDNLIKIHTEGAKKLRYLREKLSRSKNSAEKIVELQKLSKDSDYNGVFGSIRNMERILVRDKFSDIYKRVNNVPIDTQKILFEGVYDDLKSLFKYEPQIVKKVSEHIKEINNKIKNSKELLPKIDDTKIDNIKSFEDGDLPFVEISDILDIDYPEKEKYKQEAIEEQLKEFDQKINSGEILPEDIEIVKQAINDDKSIFKIEKSDESKELLKNADDFLKALEDGRKYVERLEELKSKDDVKGFVFEVMKNKKEDFLGAINALDNGFRSKNMDFETLAKNYFMAAKYIDDSEAKARINEIVEVIRRIEKEIDPLLTLESKIAALLDWVKNEYKDKDHIKEIINNQIKEYILIKGREGGLLRELLDGLDKAKDKIKYLKGMMNNIYYRHLIPTIKTLIENIEKEMEVPKDMIDEEWINRQLEGKNDDEKLDWLKLRKYWDKYEKHVNFINDEIKKCEIKVKGKHEKGIKIYSDIVELADYVLTLEGSGARQKLIKQQQEIDLMADDAFKSQRKLLFYLMSTDSDEPRKMLLEFANRYTLSIPEKQKLLKLLKDSFVPEKGGLKDILKLTDSDIAFAAVYVLRSRDPLYRRIKYLENLKNATEEKFIKYKESFDINNMIISDVINFLNKKKGVPSGEQKAPAEDQEILNDQVSMEARENITESESAVIGEEDLIQEIKGAPGEEPIELFESEDIDFDIRKNEKAMKIDQPIKEESFESFQDLDLTSWDEKKDIAEKKEKTKESSAKDFLDIEEEHFEVTDQKDSLGIEEELIDNVTEEPLKSESEIDSDFFTEEDIGKWDQGEVSSIKSTEDLLKEQIVREEFKKSSRKDEEIIKKIEERAIKTKKEIMDKVRERAHEIHEDKNKKTEDKISELLSFLTTCYPEAISKIIIDTILPVFKDKKFDSEVHGLIKSINDSIFKPALSGKDIEKNIKFFEKKLSSQNMNNIRTIVDKIKDLWEEISSIDETQKAVNEDKKEIPEHSRSLTSLLIHLSRIFPESILDEIDKKLIYSIKSEEVRNSLKLIHDNLKNIFDHEDFNLDEVKFMYVKSKFNDKDKKIFEEIVHKIEKYKVKSKIQKSQEMRKQGKSVDYKDEKNKEKENLKPIASSQAGEDSEAFFEEENKEEIFEGKSIDREIEGVLSGLTNFIKPHAVILGIVRNKKLNEEDFDVDTRREMIDNLYNLGKIFTYDGTSYIGKGQINNIVKKNLIPTPEKAIFLHKLNAFLGRFGSKEEIYEFLGVKDEMEFRQLNYNLDKYGVGREPLTHIVENINVAKEEKKPVFTRRHPKRLQRLRTKPIMVGESEKSKDTAPKVEGTELKKEPEIKKEKKEKSYREAYREKLEKAKKKDEEKKLSYSEMIKQQKSFISKTQKEILDAAERTINKSLLRLIKGARSKNDLESIERNYFGSSEFNKKNQLNLCYDIKKIAGIISKDQFLFSRFSYDQDKLKKLFDSKMRKFIK